MRRLNTQYLGILLILLTIGCRGYRRIDGKWYYVVHHEGGGDQTFVSADDDGFKVLARGKYAKDNHSVYFKRYSIEGADPDSFKILSLRYCIGKDRNRVFVDTVPIQGANPETYRQIQSLYGGDGSNIYCGTLRMDVAHPKQFRVLRTGGEREAVFSKDRMALRFGVTDESLVPYRVGDGWACDGEFYYFGPTRLVDADYDSFEVIDHQRARDRHGEFFGVRRVPAGETWTSLAIRDWE